MKDTFFRAAVLLSRNAVIVVPSLLIGLVSAAGAYALSLAGVSSWGFFGNLDAQGSGVFWQFLQSIVAVAVRILGALIAIAFTTGMAGAAWEHGKATLADGLAAFKHEGLHLLEALILLFLMGLVASALVIPTFGISLLLYMTFMIYTMPAVVVAGRSATDAIVDSVRTAARNLGLTLLLVVLIVVLALAGGLAGDAASHVPLLGQALSWVLMELVVAYATLVVVGEYLSLHRSANQAP